MENVRVLFLDIDGVLNKNRYGEDIYTDGDKNDAGLIEPRVPIYRDCYAALETIAANVLDLGVVWSTDWRRHCEEEWNGWKTPLKWLERNCPFLSGKIIGRTPEKFSIDRHGEIREWFAENSRLNAAGGGYRVLGYAVLDDYVTRGMYGFGRHFFRTWFDSGLTLSLAENVINCLNGGGFDESDLSVAI